MKTWEFTGIVLNIYSNLSAEDCKAILAKITERKYGLQQIQFGFRFKVNPSTLMHINDILLPNYPSVPLRETINGFGAFDDLNFLEWLPDLKKLNVDLIRPASLQPLVKYTKLEDLFLSGHSVSLESMSGLESLKYFIGNSKLQHIESLSTCINLLFISLSKQRLNNLNFLTNITALKELFFWQGIIKDLTALPIIGKVEHLRFSNVSQISPQQLAPINQMPFLKRVDFYSQSLVKNIDWLVNNNIEVNID